MALFLDSADYALTKYEANEILEADKATRGVSRAQCLKGLLNNTTFKVFTHKYQERIYP